MSINAKLSELELRRDAVLREMDDNATRLSEYIRKQYSPVNVLRRHIGPAIGIAATLGTLAAGTKAPRTGFMRLIWSQLFNRPATHAHATQSSGGATSGQPTADAAPAAAHTAADAREANRHGLRDIAQPIISNILLDVAQMIPWSSLMQRAREKRKNRDGQTDHTE